MRHSHAERGNDQNSGFEKHEDLLPFPLATQGERAGVRG